MHRFWLRYGAVARHRADQRHAVAGETEQGEPHEDARQLGYQGAAQGEEQRRHHRRGQLVSLCCLRVLGFFVVWCKGICIEWSGSF